VGGEQRSSLCRPLRSTIRLGGRLAPVAHLLKGGQAARGSVAPVGAKARADARALGGMGAGCVAAATTAQRVNDPEFFWSPEPGFRLGEGDAP
jgi:hypothetical protein